MSKPKDVLDPEDVQDVVREEESRGRRPIDTDALRQKQRLRRDYRKLLRIGRKEDFIQAIKHDLGLEPGSPPFEDAIRIWKDVRKF